ncbi:MAG: hypothetical protein E4H00_06670 [Myxococcales bacterium]|nr:MAG: hypothetical protein E4H00_06670 [Myxococcales bacterium]
MKRLHHAPYPVLTALLLALVNGYVANHPLYLSKTRKVDQQMAALAAREPAVEPPLILVVGNSYVRTAIQPAADAGYTKFIMNGLPLPDIAHVLQSLPDGLRVETVVVGLGYNYATPVRSLSYVYRRYEAHNPVARAWWSIPVARSYSLSSTMVKNDLVCLATGQPCRGKRDQGESLERRDESSAEHAQRVQGEVARRLREFRPFTSEVSPVFEETLLDIRAQCDRLGARMMTFTAPIYEPLRDQLDPAVLARFRETAASVSPYVDFNQRYPSWEPAYFADPTHLAPDGEGARIVTGDLQRFLQ